jgi:hypothetical protein
MATYLTDVLEREAYEDALDPVPEDDLPVSDLAALDGLDDPDGLDASGGMDEIEARKHREVFDADGEPLPDEVQAEIDALADEGVDDDLDADDVDFEMEPAARVVISDRAGTDERVIVLEQALEAAQRELERQRDLACTAVARYRQAVLAAEPDLPPEIVRGESIEAVDASISAARVMVAQVRERVAARRPSERGFPAGAPARESNARGHLTARQKIAAGLQERLI